MADRKTSKSTQPTAADVARLAGVNKATVSRAINKPDSVKASTRQKIEKAMVDLRYRPMAVAQSLARGRTAAIGLITDNRRDTYHRLRLIDGVLQKLSESDYLFELASGREDENDKSALSSLDSIRKLRMFRMRTNDGVIFDIESYGGDLFTLGRELSLPCVFVNPKNFLDFNCVMPDDNQAAQMAVRYLLQKGHRRIAYLTGSEGAHESSLTLREQGYEIAMLRAGLQPLPLFNKRTPIDKSIEDIIPEKMEKWLGGPEGATAILSYDRSVSMVLRYAYNQNLKIPESFSLMACDDAPDLDNMAVAITAVRIDRAKLGARAVEMVLERINNGGMDLATARVEPVLVERASVKNIG